MSTKWLFKQWQDGDINPTKSILAGADADFIAINDTHIGAPNYWIGSSGIRHDCEDGLTAAQRLQLILSVTNNMKVWFIADSGDIINGWSSPTDATNFYNLYKSIKATSGNRVLQVRGNHDAITASYLGMIENRLNWAEKIGDILAVGIGFVGNDGNEWEYTNLPYGVTYMVGPWKGIPQPSYPGTLETVNFLNSVISSQAYKDTNYHFIFHHFAPLDSAPTSSDTNRWINDIPAEIDAFYKHFDMAFYGHIGNPAGYVTQVGSRVLDCPAVHGDHLQQGYLSFGFLAVSIDRVNLKITVRHHNYNTGAVTDLFTYSIPSKTVTPIAPEVLTPTIYESPPPMEALI